MPAPAVTLGSTRLTHPDRVLWPDQGATKLALARYWNDVAPRALPHLADRPLMLIRCPNGRQKACFVQRHAGPGVPRAVRRVSLPDASGAPSTHLVVDDLEGLLGLVQIGTLELHGWGARAASIESPDRLVLDLDPGPDVPWARTVEAAREVRDRLAADGLRSFVKTTGGKGLHVVAPVEGAGWDGLKAYAESLARAMEADAPDRYVATAAKARREGRIYVDWLRNARAASFVVPYGPRARPGATVSTPLAWDELSAHATPDRFTLDTVPRRMKDADPWADFPATRQKLPSR